MSEEVLKQAVALIKQRQTAQAAEVVKDYIRENPKDARGWWMMANLTQDPAVRGESLRRVLSLQPDHAQARQMQAKLAAAAPSSPPIPAPAMPPPPAEELSPVGIEPDADGFPPLSAFGVAAPAGTTTPHKAAIEDVIRQRQAEREAASSQVDPRTWYYIIGGLVALGAIVTLIVIVVLIIQSRGPNLPETANSRYVTVDHPEDWTAATNSSDTLVLSVKSIDAGLINPWATLTDRSNYDYPYYTQYDLQYWTLYYMLDIDLDADIGTLLGQALTGDFADVDVDEDELVVAVVQPLPGRSRRSQGVQAYIDDFAKRLESDSDTGSFFGSQKVEFDKDDIEIDGQQGTFTRISTRGDSFFGGDKSHSALYFATVEKDDVEYLFLLAAYEPKGGKHKKLARKMAESLTLTIPQ